MPWISLSLGNKKCGQNAVDKRIKHGNGALVFVLWKSFALVFLTRFPYETTDVKESGTTAVFVASSGSLLQKSDRQPNARTQSDHTGNGKSGDVKGNSGSSVSISREDADWVRCHRRIQGLERPGVGGVEGTRSEVMSISVQV